MSVPTQVVKLVDQFKDQLQAVKSPQYKEAWARMNYIDPFFKALGWDVHNEMSGTLIHKEVVYEDTLRVEGAIKAPDYCFYTGGARKFFVEAKKPSVNLFDGRSAAFQVRRYAWSAKLPLSVLTDFEELAIYDCRVMPQQEDKASIARSLYMTYEEYPDRWDEIASLFSKEAVLSGSLDAYTQDLKKKRGIDTVDDAFLKEMEGWREILAKDLAKRNPSLTRRELNYAVQMTIDRIVFLRICEDRGIEDYGNLEALVGKDNVYDNLRDAFKDADDKYNSGLFHFREEKGRDELPDDLTLKLQLSDQPLKKIIKSLYYPESPYQFSVMPVEIMGQVYEQFLGKVISVTPDHRVVIEEKPEVRKAGGVYYTPAYIVDYIVENTVGKLLEGKTPRQVSKLKVLDPACGSGSFLIGAYTYLLEWHRHWYADNASEKQRVKVLYQGPSGEWQLTSAEKKRILLNNVYGVDIDPQAVEVTKLSLLLKVLEGETNESINSQLTFFNERALPDLDNNIKWGNSLIGPDFYETGQIGLLDEEESYRVNAFDWNAEFPDILKSGGFDAVIGNPPYLRIQGLKEYYGSQIEYLLNHYQSAVKRFDLYLLFVEKGFDLLKEGGRLGIICPHKFTNSDFGSGFREFLIQNSAVETLINFRNNLVFDQASTYTGILVLLKNSSTNFAYYEFEDMPPKEVPTRLVELSKENFAKYDLKNMSKDPWVLVPRQSQQVLNKLLSQPLTLKDVVDEILVGVQSGIDSVHLLRALEEPSNGVVKLFSDRAHASVDIETGLVKPLLRGEDVHRYAEPRHTYYCVYPYQLVSGKTEIMQESELRQRFPLGYAYLSRFRAELTEIRTRQRTNPRYWYSCHRSRDMRVFEDKKIITPEISLGCNMTLAPPGSYYNTKVYGIVPSASRPEHNSYWLGLLNSKVMWWFLSNTGYVLRGGYFVFKTNYLKPFPVPSLNFSNAGEKSLHDKVVELVERILKLRRQLSETKVASDRKLIQRQINATDHQIDRLVYTLYGLSEDEIEIVEG